MNSPARLAELLQPKPETIPPQHRDRPIGSLLLDAGVIKPESVDRILQHAQERGLRFGDAAVSLGLVSAETLRQALAYQFDYPVIAPGTSRIRREVIAAFDSAHPVVDDLRALRNQILLRWLTAEGQRNRVVAVLSPGTGEGRTFVAANLAVTFSQMGQRALLIDADMRSPRQHALFGLDNQAGLSAMLAERRVPNTLYRIEDLRDLSVVPCGGVPPNPSDLVSKAGFQQLLEGMSKSYDVIIIDTPAASNGPEAILIAARARGCVIVARQHVSTLRALRRLALDVSAVGARVVGTVLVRP